METARTELAAYLLGSDPEPIPITRDRALLPQATHGMLIGGFWPRGSAPGEPLFAMINEEPPPEVAATGHDG